MLSGKKGRIAFAILLHVFEDKQVEVSRAMILCRSSMLM
jgi:hypothetical protein